MSIADTLGELLDGLSAATLGPIRPPAEIARSVSAAWALVLDPERELGRLARERLPGSTGLSLASVVWALDSALRPAAGPELLDLAARLEPEEGSVCARPGLAALWLAGNVFTACVRPLSLALISGHALIVKASSRDDALPRLFEAALEAVDPELAERCAVVSFPGGTEALEGPLLARADLVDVFGSDQTITSVRARANPTADVVAHGHGLGLGWVGRDVTRDLDSLAAGFALDVAAYDQRGCLSPHAIVIERGAVDGAAFARALASALEERSKTLPRGALPEETAAAQLQWRGVGSARGGLIEGSDFAVSFEAEAPLRLSPGYRNVGVFEVDDARSFVRQAARFGPHLKAIGCGGDGLSLARTLPARLCPRVSAPGEMQRPGLLGLADGRPAWERWRRLIRVS